MEIIIAVINMFLLPLDYKPLEGRNILSFRHHVFMDPAAWYIWLNSGSRLLFSDNTLPLQQLMYLCHKIFNKLCEGQRSIVSSWDRV